MDLGVMDLGKTTKTDQGTPKHLAALSIRFGMMIGIIFYFFEMFPAGRGQKNCHS